MLRDLGWLKQIFVKDSSGDIINPSTDETLAEVRDTIGQVEGETVLSRLLDIWNKLVELFNTGTAKVKIWDGTNQAVIDDSGQLHVVLKGNVSEPNSSSTPLEAGASFPGEWVETLSFAVLTVNVISDQNSATDGLMIEFSSDGTNIDGDDVFTIPANRGKTFSFQPSTKYVRVSYTNGGITQSEFRLQTILKKTYVKPSSHRIQDSIIGDDDAELVKSVLTGRDPNGIFKNINSTEDGDLTISDNSSGLAIAKGDVTGTSFIHKFGNSPDFDTADNEVTIWDGAEDGTLWELMNYVFSTSADIDSMSSSNAGDTQEIVVQGLDANWEIVTQTITLNGQTRVPLNTNLIRVFRAYNDNSVNLIGHVFIYVNTPDVAPADGIPDDPTKIRAIIDPTNQQTEMCVYTVPAGKTGYMRDWYIATSGGNKASSYVFKLKSRNFGKVFRTKHTSAMDALAPIPYKHPYTEPEIFLEKTDIIMTVQSIASPASVANAVSAGFDMVLVDN